MWKIGKNRKRKPVTGERPRVEPESGDVDAIKTATELHQNGQAADKHATRRRARWQHVIWREWRYTADAEYAQALFEMVDGETVGYEAGWELTVVGALFGAVCALVVMTLCSKGAFWVEVAKGGLVLQSLLTFAALGATVGVIQIRDVLNRTTWRDLLPWITIASVAVGTILVATAGVSGMLFFLTGDPRASAMIYASSVPLGLLVGACSRFSLLKDQSSHTEDARWSCFWWHGKPTPEEMANALHEGLQHGGGKKHPWGMWGMAMQHIDHSIADSFSAVPGLGSESMSDRFVARQLLARMGGTAVPRLRQALASGDELSIRTAIPIVRHVARETRRKLKRHAKELLCSTCLTRCHVHRVRAGAVTYGIYGCRTCYQSRDFIRWPGRVVAVLDDQMTADRREADGTMFVNYLRFGKLFDFDAVKIGKVSDHDVERFCMEAGNDPDEMRHRRYKQMTCRLLSQAAPAESTVHMLRQTFNRVVSS